MLCAGRSQWWDQKFADSKHFTGDPVVATPDVTELDHNDADEFIVLATDGLWCVRAQRIRPLWLWLGRRICSVPNAARRRCMQALKQSRWTGCQLA